MEQFQNLEELFKLDRFAKRVIYLFERNSQFEKSENIGCWTNHSLTKQIWSQKFNQWDQ